MENQRLRLKEQLVNILIQDRWIQTQRICDVMMKVDRGDFWGGDPNNPNLINPASYEERPQQINFNVVISAPKLHAHVMVSPWSLSDPIFRSFFQMSCSQEGGCWTWDLAQGSSALASTRW